MKKDALQLGITSVLSSYSVFFEHLLINSIFQEEIML